MHVKIQLPSERHNRYTLCCEDFVKERIVGEKNMHSSSGCAIIRSIFPGVFRRLLPPSLIQRNKEDTAIINNNVTKAA